MKIGFNSLPPNLTSPPKWQPSSASYTMSFYASAGTPVAIAANYVDNSPNGWLEATILVDDKLYKSGRSSGNESATVSGTVQ